MSTKWYKFYLECVYVCVCLYEAEKERERIIFPSNKVEKKKKRAEIPFLTMRKDRASTL